MLAVVSPSCWNRTSSQSKILPINFCSRGRLLTIFCENVVCVCHDLPTMLHESCVFCLHSARKCKGHIYRSSANSTNDNNINTNNLYDLYGSACWIGIWLRRARTNMVFCANMVIPKACADFGVSISWRSTVGDLYRVEATAYALTRDMGQGAHCQPSPHLVPALTQTRNWIHT